MKERDRSLERLMSWARTASNKPSFEISPELRLRVLASWRSMSAERGDLNEAVIRFLRWAVAYSVVVMALSILFNYDVFDSPEPVIRGEMPTVYFHSRVPNEIYVP